MAAVVWIWVSSDSSVVIGNMNTELVLATRLRKYGISGWRRHQRLFGNPDFIFLRAKLAVFVDGCFWHGCPKHATQPASNRVFWRRKLARNKTRDQLVNRALRQRGWTVLRIWQHELIRKNEVRLLRRIHRALL
jgi:DNA mismatch endonuclease (patch repair protein)